MLTRDHLVASLAAVVGVSLYLILNWSYTTAVFTDPGSPLNTDGSGYSQLLSHESALRGTESVTVKSTGEKRYCKKCQSMKPDRTHHCSSCKRCVLKMDHHCPWLATCVGLKNYKAFLLFLVYTTFYCWLCFWMTASWLWGEVFNESSYDSLTPVNYVMLCVIAGIIGLVLTGFTGWHLSLACKGQTTIECLEKTRYLTPLRNSINRNVLGNRGGPAAQGYGQQLAENHANALPGITRPEEGESVLQDDDIERGGRTHRTYQDMERSRERDRYEDYLDEKDSEKLPHAFDLGWRRNLAHLLGPNPLLQFLPICNTTGDGWHWESNPRWLEARENIRSDRERTLRRQGMNGHSSQYACDHDEFGNVPERHYISSNNFTDAPYPSSRSNIGHDFGAQNFDSRYAEEDDDSRSSQVSLKTLRRKSSFDGFNNGDGSFHEISSDGEP